MYLSDYVLQTKNIPVNLTFFVKKTSAEKKSTGRLLKVLEDKEIGFSNPDFLNLVFNNSKKQDNLLKDLKHGFFVEPVKPNKERYMPAYKKELKKYKQERMDYLNRYFFDLGIKIKNELLAFDYDDDFLDGNFENILNNYIPFKVKTANGIQMVSLLKQFKDYAEAQHWNVLVRLEAKSFEDRMVLLDFASLREKGTAEEIEQLNTASLVVPELIQFFKHFDEREERDQAIDKMVRITDLSDGNMNAITLNRLMGGKVFANLNDQTLVKVVPETVIDWLTEYQKLQDLRENVKNTNKDTFRQFKKWQKAGKDTALIAETLNIKECVAKEMERADNFGDYKKSIKEQEDTLFTWNFM